MLPEGATGTPEQFLQQLQSLSTHTIDAMLKRCTSGDMAEPVLELFRSVHGQDDVGRKNVAQREVRKRLSDAMREFESLGPDLPKREQQRLLLRRRCRSSSPQDLGSPSWAPSCFREKFEADTKSISQEMIKQASSRRKEAVESIRSEVDGARGWQGVE